MARIAWRKRPGELEPNLGDYQRACNEHDWAVSERRFPGLAQGHINIAHEAVGRHAAGSLCDKVAIRWLGKNGAVEEFTYGKLDELSSRFANVLTGLGLTRGDRVFALTGRIPALYVAALGTLKAGGIFSPLFSAFGPEPIRARMAIGGGRFLVTTKALLDKKVTPVLGGLGSLEHVILTDTLDGLLSSASPSFATVQTSADEGALLHFTSGTTGTPKGALHVHRAVVMHDLTARLALDLHPDDVLWCTADPGWVTGTSYGIVAPLVAGVTMIVDEADLDVERWYDILERQKVTVWYTAPTAIRMLMRAGEEPIRKHDLSALRFLASVGEPLNPDAVLWSDRVFGRPFHDNWWQTETGAIMIANFASTEVRPGSMGLPMPGIHAAVVHRTERGIEPIDSEGESAGVLSARRPIEEPDVQGELALRPGWPSMFQEYFRDPERTAKCFRDGWYLTGDLVRRDADGYFWFVGRADDVIKSAGHLIGPFEVESALLRHPAVAEAGVIGKPDPIAGEMVKAFVALKPGFSADETTTRSIIAHARKELGAAVAPKELAFVATLPRTRTGKIMRRLLRARELGLPEGDLSTLEGPS